MVPGLPGRSFLCQRQTFIKHLSEGKWKFLNPSLYSTINHVNCSLDVVSELFCKIAFRASQSDWPVQLDQSTQLVPRLVF